MKFTALQLLNQCDLTVMSSIVPHPLPTATLPASQSPTRDELLINNDRPSYSTHKAGLAEDEKLGPHDDGMVEEEEDQGEVEEVIMIDDVSSNEEVAMEPAVTTQDDSGEAIVSVDGSHDSSRIDLNQDDDNELRIAFEKFIDQSSDDTSSGE